MVNEPEQIDFDWGAPTEDGYASWQWDRREAVRKIAELWGLPLGRGVRLRSISLLELSLGN